MYNCGLSHSILSVDARVDDGLLILTATEQEYNDYNVTTLQAERTISKEYAVSYKNFDKAFLFRCIRDLLLVFKGGTSLSKSYHAIERFSEDIDLILDWRKIIKDDSNPWDERSKEYDTMRMFTQSSILSLLYVEETVARLSAVWLH